VLNRERLCALYDQYCIDWHEEGGFLCELQLCSLSTMLQNLPEIKAGGYGHLRPLGYKDDTALLLSTPTGVEYEIRTIPS